MTPLFAHLSIPSSTAALLFDMDGVLLDSLQLDRDVLDPLFTKTLKRKVQLEAGFIKSIFAYDPATFLELILDHLESGGAKIPDRAALSPALLEEYLHLRRTAPIPLLPGVKEILEAAQKKHLKLACVSNNPLFEVESILERAALRQYFSEVVGNDQSVDGKPLAKKPAPDCYLYAAQRLGVMPGDCVVFEDSVLGARAGLAAKSHVVGLLTGSASAPELRAVQPHQILPNFTERPL